MATVAGTRKLTKNNGVDFQHTELRSTEALACALAARFYGSPERVKRTQVYSERIGEALGMSQAELQPLKVASLLYDIGLLGIPEAILSKKSGLTSEEFDRIKTHATLGAELIEQMGLPKATAGIVAAHHERWNGSGYPRGLKQEEIPLGARILAVVDCFCALLMKGGRAKESVVEAVTFISSQSGISFDPRVVRVLTDRWCEFESLVEKTSKPGVLSLLEQAKHETHELVNLYRNLGNSLHLPEILATLAHDLKSLVDYDGLAIYIERDGGLTPEYVAADAFLLSDCGLSLGEGLCLRVADAGVAVLNADPCEDEAFFPTRTAYRSSLAESETNMVAKDFPRPEFRSLLAVPLQGSQSVAGVLAFFRHEPASFHDDDLRILLEIGPRIAAQIENAVKHQMATNSARTDYMTGLANSRALFERLDDELARCSRTGGSLTVLVCDLDGFEQVNDRFGHLTGNRVLCSVARILELNCRGYDFVARMGGDEFVMVIPDLPVNAVEFKRQQLCRAVEEAAAMACAECGVTASIGQARYGEDGKDAESLLAAADTRMYRAKYRAGRRRVAPASYELTWQSASVQ